MEKGDIFYKCYLQKAKVEFIYMRIDLSKNIIEYTSNKRFLKQIFFSELISIKTGQNDSEFSALFNQKYQDTCITITYESNNSLLSFFTKPHTLNIIFKTEK